MTELLAQVPFPLVVMDCGYDLIKTDYVDGECIVTIETDDSIETVLAAHPDIKHVDYADAIDAEPLLDVEAHGIDTSPVDIDEESYSVAELSAEELEPEDSTEDDGYIATVWNSDDGGHFFIEGRTIPDGEYNVVMESYDGFPVIRFY